MEHTKTKVALLALAIGLGQLLPSPIMAQQDGSGGLFGRGNLRDGIEAQGGILNQGFGGTQGGVTNQTFGGTQGGITNQTFGETPLGSGLLVMLAAGAGYATIKSKKKKNNKSNLKK